MKLENTNEPTLMNPRSKLYANVDKVLRSPKKGSCPKPAFAFSPTVKAEVNKLFIKRDGNSNPKGLMQAIFRCFKQLHTLPAHKGYRSALTAYFNESTSHNYADFIARFSKTSVLYNDNLV